MHAYSYGLRRARAAMQTTVATILAFLRNPAVLLVMSVLRNRDLDITDGTTISSFVAVLLPEISALMLVIATVIFAPISSTSSHTTAQVATVPSEEPEQIDAEITIPTRTSPPDHMRDRARTRSAYASNVVVSKSLRLSDTEPLSI